MNLQQTIDSAVKETKDKQDIKSILLKCFDNDKYLWSLADKELHDFVESILTSSIKKAVEEAYKEIEVEKKLCRHEINAKDSKCQKQPCTCMLNQVGSYNEALSLIEKKKSEFLNK